MTYAKQNKLAAVTATLLLGVAEALAQDQANGEESKRHIIVSIADRKLALVEDDRVIKIYPIAVGASTTPSPTGSFKIATRIKNPTWYGPHGQVVQPGKSNPLGDRWMGLTRKGYGIHGTNAPGSIGQAASHGCIRMRKADVEELFELAKVGDVVEMVANGTKEYAWIFGATEMIVSAE